jgi:hypothetical protein
MPRTFVAVIAALMTGWASLGSAAPCAGFTDLDDSSEFCVNVTWMKNRGVTLGCTLTQYCPNADVTRLQMAAFMNRLGNVTFQQGGNAFGFAATLGTTDDNAVEVLANGSRVMRYEPDAISPNLVGGHPENAVFPGVHGATIGGGGTQFDPALGNTANEVTGDFGTVSGGHSNAAGGGLGTNVQFATIGGGNHNVASGGAASIGGGTFNFASGGTTTVAGGFRNVASGHFSTVGGGQYNTASGFSSIAGGRLSEARGDYSIALGHRAKTFSGLFTANGAIVLADGNDFDFSELTPNRFAVRATGGVRFVLGIDGNGAATWTCGASNASGWACSSDRSLKQDLVALDGRAVLERLSALPIYQWQPKGAAVEVRHYGPMAQDFYAAFGLGDDEKMIGMQDADGVALAAIQGLNAKLETKLAEKDAEISELRRRYESEVADLRRAVDVLMARTSIDTTIARVGRRSD